MKLHQLQTMLNADTFYLKEARKGDIQAQKGDGGNVELQGYRENDGSLLGEAKVFGGEARVLR